VSFISFIIFADTNTTLQKLNQNLNKLPISSSLQQCSIFFTTSEIAFFIFFTTVFQNLVHIFYWKFLRFRSIIRAFSSG